jgi:hypothetical protein
MAREGYRSSEEVIYQKNRKYTTLFDFEGGSNPIYIGKAQCGTLESEPFWQISKITWSGSKPSSIKYANSVSTFSNIWDNRAGYTYG